MRVRYGKPIKVKSLLGNQTNFSLASGNNGDQLCFGNNTYAWSRDNIGSSNYFQNASLIQNHKYYVYFDSYSDRTYTYVYNNGTIYLDENWGITTISGTTTSHGIIQVNNRSIESLSKFYVGKSNGSTWPAPTMLIIIDLTEIGLDTLTAQEFYNKYNKYFPLIATGEEITIDDKAGQIAYKNLEEDSIRCKISGGSSDVYYRYNQLCFSIQSNLTGSGTTQTETENGFLTTSSNTGGNRGSVKNILIVNGHKYYIRATLTQSETGNCFVTIYNNNYSTRFGDKTVALTSNITNSFEYITTSNFTDTNGIICFYMNQNHTAQAGDTLLSEYINVIDLTDWFGAGKEPSTVQEFKEKFTKEYYGYCPTPIKLTRYQIEALPNYGYNQLVQETKKNNSMPASIGTGWRDAVGNICATTIDHKYIITAQLVGNYPLSNVQVGVGDNTDWNEGRVIFEQTNKDLQHFLVSCKTTNSGLDVVTVNSNSSSVSGSGCYINNVMVIDLTDWYGAGNEPTTIEEFKQTFPNKYYPYSKKRLLNKYMINKLKN